MQALNRRLGYVVHARVLLYTGPVPPNEWRPRPADSGTWLQARLRQCFGMTLDHLPVAHAYDRGIPGRSDEECP
jgi:hypothetical protein